MKPPYTMFLNQARVLEQQQYIFEKTEKENT